MPMNPNFLCCIGAELKNSTQQTTRMSQVYLYRAFEDQTLNDMVQPGFFDAAIGIIRKDDLLLLYSPNEAFAKYTYARVSNVNRDGVEIESIGIDAKDISVDTDGFSVLDGGNLQEIIAQIDSLLPLDVSSLNKLIAESRLQSEITRRAVIKDSDVVQEMQSGLKAPSAEFDNAPTTNDTTTYQNATSDSLVRKEQVDEVVQDIKTSSLTFVGYVSATEPSSATYAFNTGDLWLNSATMPTAFPFPQANIKEWNGSAWVAYSQDYTPANFDFFRNVNNNEGYYWFGGEWVVMSTDMSTTYFQLNPISGKWEIKSNVNLPGSPTTTTPSTDDNSTNIATTEFTANAITAEKQKTITNCITYIPQDIKLELTDGTLTLKAGSKVYVPNGVGVFDTITIANDIVRTAAGDGTGKMLFYKNGTISARETVAIVSGSTPPSSSLGQYLGWYDTTNNVIKLTSDGGSTWDSGWSFPFGITHDTSGAVFLDQVFNGFGYIDSTIFALPGIKGLIPNGRNADGTLNNTEFVSTNVVVRTFLTSTLKQIGFNGTYIGLSDVQFSGYDKLTNTNYSADTRWDFCLVGIVNNSKRIFSTKQPFAATDYNDTEFIAHQPMPGDKYIDLTLGASGSQYAAPADGYIILLKKGNYQEYITIDSGYDKAYADYAYNDQVVCLRLSVKKGRTFNVWYSASKDTQRFAFIYAQGAQ